MRILSCLLCRKQPKSVGNGTEIGYPTQIVKEPSAHKRLELGEPAQNDPVLQATAGLESIAITNYLCKPEHVRPAVALKSDVTPGDANATSLLEGLSFTTSVLGVGTYGITVRGFLNGFEVAVKFSVTTVVNRLKPDIQKALAPCQGLVHPQICKIYETRGAVLADGLFDELEANREQYLQRQYRQRELLQQPHQQVQNPSSSTASGVAQSMASQPPHDSVFMLPAGPADTSQGGSRTFSGNKNISWVRSTAVARQSGSPRRRIYYKPRHSASCPLQCPLATPNTPAPLEQSDSPLGVLHEILHRLDAAMGQQVTLVVMEYCSRGTLHHAIDRSIFQPCRTWGLRVARRALVRSMAEVARAMLHLHRADVMHGGLKPSNLLLQAHKGDRRGCTVKVADVALSQLLSEGRDPISACKYGTPQYMAPEALLGHMGPAADVWSFGVILCEVMTQSPPYGSGSMPSDTIVLGVINGSLKLNWPPRPASVLAQEAAAAAPTAVTVAAGATSCSNVNASKLASGRVTVGGLTTGDSYGGADSSLGGLLSRHGGHDGGEDSGIYTAASLAQHFGLQFRRTVGPTSFDLSSACLTCGGITSGVTSAPVVPSTVAAFAITTGPSTTTAAVNTAAALSSCMFAITESQDPTGFTVASTANTGANFMLMTAPADKLAAVSGFLSVDNANLLRRAAINSARPAGVGGLTDVKPTDSRAPGATAATATTATASTTDPFANVKDLDLDLVWDCLITLGRRCTHRDPEQRPYFAEILGELTDLDVIMKTQGTSRAGR